MDERHCVLVTAAGRGIGAACARAVHERGHHPVLMSRSENVLELGRELGAEAMVGDTTSPADLDRLVGRALERHGRVDGAIYNSGLSRDTNHFDGRRFDVEKAYDLLGTGDDVWREMFDQYFLGAVRMARAVTPVMQRHGKGAIVAISAMASREAYDSYPTSSTVRRAVDGFAKLYSDRYGRDGLRMNVLSPGVVATMPWSEAVRRAIPAQRVASPEEIGRIAAFLVSDEAAYIAGQNIVADGGLNRTI